MHYPKPNGVKQQPNLLHSWTFHLPREGKGSSAPLSMGFAAPSLETSVSWRLALSSIYLGLRPSIATLRAGATGMPPFLCLTWSATDCSGRYGASKVAEIGCLCKRCSVRGRRLFWDAPPLRTKLCKAIVTLAGNSKGRLLVGSDIWGSERHLVVGDVTKTVHSFSALEQGHFFGFHCRKWKWTGTRSWSPQMPSPELLTPKTHLWRNGPWVYTHAWVYVIVGS